MHRACRARKAHMLLGVGGKLGYIGHIGRVRHICS